MTYLCSPVILMNIFFMYICVSEMFLEREEMNIIANLFKGITESKCFPTVFYVLVFLSFAFKHNVHSKYI